MITTELKNIVTARTIVETGSYQRAARKLNYAQSTITFQVGQLEDELGIKLFERRGQSMQLTQQGQQALPYLDRVVESIDQLKAASAQGHSPQGELKVALPESIVTYQMQPVLREFKRCAPDVRLSLCVENCYSLYDRLLIGAVDIAIHYDVADYPRGFAANALATYPLTLVSAPEMSESDRDFITPRIKKRVSHISNDSHALYMRILNTYLTGREITLAPELEVWSIESVKRCVESELGVAYLPRFTVEKELSDGRLIEVPTEIEDGSMTAICVHDERRWISPAVQLFLDLVEKHFHCVDR